MTLIDLSATSHRYVTLLDQNKIVYAPRVPPSYCLRSARPAEAATNFERPFTPRTSLRSSRNFGNTRFRRFANFDFLTPKNFFRKKNRIFFSGFHHFRSILEELGFF